MLISWIHFLLQATHLQGLLDNITCFIFSWEDPSLLLLMLLLSGLVELLIWNWNLIQAPWFSCHFSVIARHKASALWHLVFRKSNLILERYPSSLKRRSNKLLFSNIFNSNSWHDLNLFSNESSPGGSLFLAWLDNPKWTTLWMIFLLIPWIISYREDAHYRPIWLNFWHLLPFV